MKLVPYDIKKLEVKGYKKCSNQKVIDEFLNSEAECVEVVDYPHKNAWVCASTMRASVNRMHLSDSVRVIMNNGRVFMVKIVK